MAWRPLSDLIDDPDQVRDWIWVVRAALAERGGRSVADIDAAAAASLAHLGLVGRLVAAATGRGPGGNERRDVRLTGVRWRPTEVRGVPELWVPVGSPPPDLAADPLDPVTAAVAAVGQVSTMVLEGNVASSLGEVRRSCCLLRKLGRDRRSVCADCPA